MPLVPSDRKQILAPIDRRIGRSFGYNTNETDLHLLPIDGLIHTVVDTVSKNGNVLINVGPRADGSIPEAQIARLEALGAWLAVNGDGIYGARGVNGPTKCSKALPTRFPSHPRNRESKPTSSGEWATKRSPVLLDRWRPSSRDTSARKPSPNRSSMP